MCKPESLVARVLKARYFPHSSFLDSKLGHNPSYFLRSLWTSRNILLNGCRWCIGDGKKVRVMQHPSLRSIQSSLMQSSQKQEVFDMVVHDLMV